MAQYNELLSTPEEIEALAKELNQAPVIAFDTEFIRETTFFPTVEIIQVATENDSWLVDAQAFKKRGIEGLRPLLDVFENPKILKILHAAQGDQECLYTSFGVVASPSLDTAAAASLCGYGDSIGLGNLMKAALGVTIKKGHARTNWSVRPLPAQLAEYAHADVDRLVELSHVLFQQLDKLDRREWAMRLSAKWEDKSLYESDPEAMAEKFARGGRIDARTFATLIELIRWREVRVRQLNLPRRWVADDTVLLDLASVKPRDLAHLSAFRGLNKGELKNSGEAILAAIRAGETAEAPRLERRSRSEIPTQEELQAIDLLKCYLGILADERKVALKFIASAADLVPLIRCTDAKGIEELIERQALTPEAAALVGEDVLAFLWGERALSIVKNPGGAQIMAPRVQIVRNSQ